MGAVTVRGEVPGWALRLGDGYGAGTGYGDGYADGSGTGYGYGYGYGYGAGDGYGDGYGHSDGYGSGSGSGDGYGDGSGSSYGDGSGDGSGSGSGSGYGHGSGDGYGSDLERSVPVGSVHVTHTMLRGACADQVRLFCSVFPDGAVYPDDMPRAIAAGLYVSWAYHSLGLLPVIDERIPG